MKQRISEILFSVYKTLKNAVRSTYTTKSISALNLNLSVINPRSFVCEAKENREKKMAAWTGSEGETRRPQGVTRPFFFSRFISRHARRTKRKRDYSQSCAFTELKFSFVNWLWIFSAINFFLFSFCIAIKTSHSLESACGERSFKILWLFHEYLRKKRLELCSHQLCSHLSFWAFLMGNQEGVFVSQL